MSPRSRRSKLARLSTAIGLVVAAVGAVFVARAITREVDSARAALADADLRWLALSFPVALVGMTGIGLPWRRALALVGAATGRRATLVWYFVGQLGKYVPGGVWPVVGRAELARRGGVPRPAAYGSVGLSLAATYLAAVLTTAALLPFDLGAHRGVDASLLVLLLLPLGLAGLHPAVLTWGRQLVERLVRRPVEIAVPSWGDSVVLVLRHVPSWLLIGTATWLVTRSFDPSAPYLNVVLATVVSWIVGFVVVPVPGGIGVREAAFTAAATSLPPGIGATAAIVARLLFMVVDATGAGLASLVWRRWPGGVGISGTPTPPREAPPCEARAGSSP